MKSLFSLLMLSFLCCYATPSRADHDISITEGMNAALGEGYSSQQDRFKGACVTGIGESVPSLTSSSFNFSASVSKESIANELGFDAKGRAQLGVVGTTLAAKFMKASVGDAYSISAVYSGYYKFKDDALLNPELTPQAAKLTEVSRMGNTVIKNPEFWNETCGDEFVVRREFGAKLFFSIRIDFKSEEEKNAFSSRFKLDAPLVNADVAVNKAASSVRKDTRITVSGLQIGGDVSQLTAIFGTNGGTISAANEDGATTFINCSMGDFEKCKVVLAKAVKYATATDEGFPSQLRHPAHHALLKVHTKSYKTLAVYNNHTSEAKLGFENARGKLIELFHQNYDLSVQTSRLVTNPLLRLSPRQQGIMREVDYSISKNIARLVEANQRCFEVPRECISQLAILRGQSLEEKPIHTSGPSRFFDWAKARLSKEKHTQQIEQVEKEPPLAEIDRSNFIIRPETFAQYCDMGMSPLAHLAEKLTVKSLVAKAKKIDEAPFLNNNDYCEVAQEILSHQFSLDLRPEKLKDPTDDADAPAELSTTISDLKAVSTLTQLVRLNLEGNQIVDVSPLKSLVNLKVLSLSKNNLLNVDGLEELRELEKLDLSENQLKTVDNLASHPTLKVLNLVNNKQGIQCPFADLSRCVSVDYRNGWQFYPIKNYRIKEIGRENHQAVRLPGDRVLVMGGNRGAVQRGTPSYAPDYSESEIYDINTRRCMPIPGIKISSHNSTSMILKDGRVLVIGGYGSEFIQNEKGIRSGHIHTMDGMGAATAYNLTGKDTKLHMKELRAMHTATMLMNGTVLVVGGGGGMGCGCSIFDSVNSTAEIFNPTDNKFRRVPDSLKTARAGHTATLLENGNVLITGGINGGSVVREAEIYDVQTSRFIPVRSVMNSPRYFHQATLLTRGPLKGKVLITGGYTSLPIGTGAVDTAELFDPDTQSFEELDSRMTAPRGEHTATLLENGSVLLVGGEGETRLASAEVFDSTLGSFILIPSSMAKARARHTATPVSKCRVLIVGGGSDRYTYEDCSAELLSYPELL